MNNVEIIGIVIICVLVLIIFYLFLRWYTWEKVLKINPNVPRVAVDLDEYKGRWYEIGRNPHWFEKDCNNAFASYRVVGDKVRVINQCYKNGKVKVVRGMAHPTPNDGVFGVEFFPGIFGNYTVAYRDPKTSIVTNSDKSSLWILYREPKMPKEHKKKIMNWLKKNNFDTSKLEFPKNDTTI